MSSGVFRIDKWMSKELLCKPEDSLGDDLSSLQAAGGGDLSQVLPASSSIDCNCTKHTTEDTIEI